MSRRRSILVAAFAFAFAAAVVVFAVSLGSWELYVQRVAGFDGGWSIGLRSGRLVAMRQHLVSSYISVPADPSWKNGGGFSYEQRRFGPGGAVGGKVMAEHVAIPLYPLPVLSGLLLLWAVSRYRRSRMPGQCVKCAYDLRATPDRCPECGTEPNIAAAAS